MNEPSPQAQLQLAEQLRGNPSLDPAARARAVAFLVRRALERAARALLIRRYAIERHTSFHAQFLALSAVVDEDLARDAELAWSQLSEACHHRTAALPPGPHQLERWLATAHRLVDALREPSARAPHPAPTL